MSAIKNVGIQAVQAIHTAHQNLGRDFKSIYDFCSHIDTRIVNKRALEGLVLAGAFDSCGGSRAQNFYAIEEALSIGSKIKSAKEFHTDSLFGGSSEAIDFNMPSLPDVRPWDNKERLAKERQVLGFYLSDHPLRKYETEYNSFATVHLGEPSTFQFGEIVRACGVITDVSPKTDKQGRQMAFFKLDDFSGSCDCLMFSKSFSEFSELIRPESTILIKGKLESSGDAIKLHVDEAISLDAVKSKLTKRIGIILDSSLHDEYVINLIKMLMEENEGKIPVLICVKDNGSIREFAIDNKVNLTETFIESIKKLLGDESLIYFTT